MAHAQSTPRGSSHGNPGRCDFCGYGVPEAPVLADPDSRAVFCSERCRSAFEAGERPFVDRHRYTRRSTGVAALDALLPVGFPANSFVLLSGAPGIRHRELQTELVWRALTRGEPAVIVALVGPPTAVVDEFLELGWNVLPYVESRQLQIVDGFTPRLRSDHQTPVRQTDWNEHLRARIEPVVSRVEDATNVRALENRLLGALEAVDATGTGVVVIDSLNELEAQAQTHRARQFLQEIRAEVCKRLSVPIFASVTTAVEESYSIDHSYLFDGIVDMHRDEDLVPPVRLKRLSVRKMDGVRYLPHWAPYDNFGDGFVIFDVAQVDAAYPSPATGLR